MGVLSFPKAIPVLETKQLRLREITESDLDAYYALYSDERVLRMWGTLRHQSAEDTRKLITYLRAQFESSTGIRWGLELKSNGEFVGDVGFWRIVPERQRAEAGAKLAADHWSGGLMSEALTAIIQCAFETLGMHSVEANIDPTNRGALRMVEKVGFVKEGHIREHTYSPYEKRYLDTELFSIVKTTWKPHKGLL